MTGVSFGLTSGVITALGMVVGLDSATSSKLVVVAGLVVMAIADGLADACGLHVAEETEMSEDGECHHTQWEVWLTTAFTFLSVAGFILTFTIPILFFPLESAILIDIVWGMALLIVFNVYIARVKKENAIKIILEHVALAVIVIVVSYGLGHLIELFLG